MSKLYEIENTYLKPTKLNRMLAWLLPLLTLFILFTVNGIHANAETYAKSTSKTTSQSYSSGGSVTFTIPNLVRYGNVYASNGGSVSHSRNGDTITVNVSGGNYAGYNYSSQSQSYYSTAYPSSSISYNSGGWSGTLTRGTVTESVESTYISSGHYVEDGYYKTVQDKSYQIIGYETRCHNSDGSHDHAGSCDYDHNTAYEVPIYGWVVTGSHQEWVSTGSHWEDTSHYVYTTYYSTTYSGTVSRPYYQYTVYLDYTANRAPEIDMSISDTYYSAVSGRDTIKIAGRVRDVDTIPTPDTARLSFSIIDSKGTPIPQYNNVNLGTYTGSESWSSFSQNVPIDEKIPDGQYKVVVSAIDRESEKTTYTKDIYVDRQLPNAPGINLSKEGWTIPTVNFTLTDKGDNGNSGIQKIEYQINQNGNWITYNAQVDIPPALKGKIPVQARATDRSGNVSAIATSYVYIDNIPPVIDSAKIVTEENGTQKIVVKAKDNETGIPEKGYRYYVKQEGVDTDFRVLKDWGPDTEYVLPKEPLGAKFTYYVEVRDFNNNITKSEKLDYVTPPKVKNIGVREGDFDNTITIEFEKNYSKGPIIEIYREGNLAGVLKEGTLYVDENLDYERDYTYKFITVVGEGANRVESMPIFKTVTIGKPTLEMKLDSKNYYSTPFTDEYTVTGVITYRKGGKVGLSLFGDEKETNKISNKELTLAPYIKTAWKLKGEYTGTKPTTVYVTGDLSGAESTGLYKRKFNAQISKKLVNVQRVSDYGKYGITAHK